MVARVPLTVGNKPKTGISALMGRVQEKRPQGIGVQMWEQDPEKFEKALQYGMYKKSKEKDPWYKGGDIMGAILPSAWWAGETAKPVTGGQNIVRETTGRVMGADPKGTSRSAKKASAGLSAVQQGKYDPQRLMSEQEALNRAGMETSLGSSRWVIDPETGERTLVQTLTPGLESALQEQIAGLGDVAPYQQAVMDEARKALDPIFDRELEAIRNELFGRGIPEGSEIWNDRMQEFQARKDSAYASAFNQALTQGQAVQGQQFSQLATLLSGAPQTPYTTVDVLGSYQPQLQAQGIMARMRGAERAIEEARRQDLIGGAFSLGSAFLGGA